MHKVSVSAFVKKLTAIFLCFLLLTGCDSVTGSVRLEENKKVYNADRSDSLDVLYITAGQYTDQDGKVWTLQELRDYVGVDLDIQLPILLREGSDHADQIAGGYGNQDKTYNASIQLRGNTASPGERSYKIAINQGQELYHMQDSINLMKYQKDLSRVKTKFYFDLTAYVEDIPGFRTRLVQVKMRDEGGDYQDYGLYTVLEQPNRQYLKGHNLSEDTLIYKADAFTFHQQAALVSEDDPRYNQEAFEQYLSLSEGSTKHNPLVSMLDALNDTGNEIDDVIDTYFSRDNLLSFTALNILLRNPSVVDGDYVLMYRKEDKKWFLTAWNCEKILSSPYQEVKRQKPVSLYNYELFNDNLLYQRFYSKKETIEQLSRRVDSLYRKLRERAELLAEQYVSLIAPQVVKVPDINLLPNTVALVDDYILSFGSLMDSNYQAYQDSIKLPYSFSVQTVEAEGDSITVSWDRGLNGEDTMFQASLYRDAGCTNLVAESEELTAVEHTFSGLEHGEYYAKVTAVNENGRQISRSLYINPFGKYYYGVDKADVR